MLDGYSKHCTSAYQCRGSRSKHGVSLSHLRPRRMTTQPFADTNPIDHPCTCVTMGTPRKRSLTTLTTSGKTLQVIVDSVVDALGSLSRQEVCLWICGSYNEQYNPKYFDFNETWYAGRESKNIRHLFFYIYPKTCLEDENSLQFGGERYFVKYLCN